ncbi:MAG TPA: TatD family hydrolase, partial [Bacillaceae bacterium]
YEQEIRQLVELYPLGQIMVETDGPWRFEGMFSGRMTHPEMIHHSIEAIAAIKKEDTVGVYERVLRNTEEFYRI